ncbi:MAG: TonB family protein [Gemmatimonadaceae bacterium]
MQVTLSESDRTRKRSMSGTIVSVLLHTVILAGAVAGTGYSKTRPIVEVVDTLIYTPPKPAPALPVPTHHSGLITGEVSPGLPPIPDTIDPVDPVIELGAISTAPTSVAGEFERPAFGGATVTSPTHVEGDPYDAIAVEKTVVPRPGNPTPRYPPFLASAGVEGIVVARFVVDTMGRVELQSILIVQSTQAQFERAVRNAIPGMRFIPAEVRGARVRQLVEQSFGFELKH